MLTLSSVNKTKHFIFTLEDLGLLNSLETRETRNLASLQAENSH
ncbi:hypothetical protein [Nostoc sp.]